MLSWLRDGIRFVRRWALIFQPILKSDLPHSKGVDFLVDARFWGGWTGRGPGFSPVHGSCLCCTSQDQTGHSATYWSDSEVSFDHVKRDAEKMGLTKEEIDRVFTGDTFDTGRLENV